jgi:alkyl hydroperoxide reductase subunit F
MNNIEIYTRQRCSYCAKAKALLKSKGLTYRETDVTSDPGLEQDMIERSKRRTVPQVFINSEPIGSYDDLVQFNATGGLDRVLEITSET